MREPFAENFEGLTHNHKRLGITIGHQRLHDTELVAHHGHHQNRAWTPRVATFAVNNGDAA